MVGRAEESEPPASCQGAERSGTSVVPKVGRAQVQEVETDFSRGPSHPQEERRVWLFLIYMQRGESRAPIPFLLGCEQAKSGSLGGAMVKNPPTMQKRQETVWGGMGGSSGGNGSPPKDAFLSGASHTNGGAWRAAVCGARII